MEKVFDDIDACFSAHDKDGDGLLNSTDFGYLCRGLFVNDEGTVYDCSAERQQEMFQVFDFNKDGFIDKEEFKFCWSRWIKKIVHPVSVLLVIDVQNDFIDGSLSLKKCDAGQDGGEVINPINALLDSVTFDAVFYSLDWHPPNHVSFIDNLLQRKIHSSSPLTADEAKLYDLVIFDGSPPIKQHLWPRHCVQNSWGSELHKDLKIVPNAVYINKGTNPEVDSCSAFFDNMKLSCTELDTHVKKCEATDVYVCGIAYDVCVGATATDALDLGYRTILIADCCRGITLNGIEKTKSTLTTANGIIVDSKQVKCMVEGKDRRPELGYKLCLKLKAEQSLG